MNYRQITLTWKHVFGNWKYMILTIFIAILFYSINAVIGNWKAISSLYNPLGLLGSAKLFFILAWNFGNTIRFSSFVSLILISILFGILFSLLVYRTKMIKTAMGKIGIFASVGIFIGVLAPGCVSCGVGLLSLFGISSAFLVFLPLEGLELSVLSIALLSFSVLKISDTMYRCKIPIRKNKQKIERNK